MKKIDILRALIASTAFSFLYAFLLIVGPGPGLQASLLLTLDFKAIFMLILAAVAISPVFQVIVLLLSNLIAHFMRETLFDEEELYIKYCCNTAIIIAFLAIVLGFALEVNW